MLGGQGDGRAPNSRLLGRIPTAQADYPLGKQANFLPVVDVGILVAAAINPRSHTNGMHKAHVRPGSVQARDQPSDRSSGRTARGPRRASKTYPPDARSLYFWKT